MDLRTQIEERAAKALKEYGTETITERTALPPTREWTPQARVEVLSRLGVDSTLLIAVGARSSEITPFAQQTFGTTNLRQRHF